MKALLLSALATTGILAACGEAGEPEPTPTTHVPEVAHVVGTFVLKQEVLPYTGPRGLTPTPVSSCRGRGGYKDIGPGMEVLLSADGTTLAVGRFSTGRVTSLSQLVEQCEFTFEFDVPAGRPFYTVKVGSRGERTYTFEQISTSGALAFTIGP